MLESKRHAGVIRGPALGSCAVAIALCMASAASLAGPGSEASPAPSARAQAEPSAAIAADAAPSAGAADVDACDSAEGCGRRAFQAGIQAFQNADYTAALSFFREAQAYRPHPTILFNVALAESKLGELVSSLEHLERVLNDPSTPTKLLERVRTERDQVSARLAGVAVEQSGTRLYVDGVLAPGDPPSVRVNPGRHALRVFAGGVPVLERVVELEPGERIRLALPEGPRSDALWELRGKSRESDPFGEVGPERLPARAPLERPRPLGPWWVAGGGVVTLALAGFTVWSGLETRRSFHAFEDEVSGLNASQARGRMHDGRSQQTRTNVLLGATLALAAGTTAVALTLVEWRPEHRSSRRVAIEVGVGPTRLTLGGRF